MSTVKELLEQSNPKLYDLSFDDINEVVKSEREPSRDLLEGLDLYYRKFTRALISSGTDKKTLSEFSRLLSSQLNFDTVAYLKEQPNRFDLVLKGYQNIINDEIKFLKSFDIEITLKKPNVKKLLEILAEANDDISQADVIQQVGLTKTHVTNLLSEMQSFRLVKKTKVGRENILTITDSGRAAYKRSKEPIPSSPFKREGITQRWIGSEKPAKLRVKVYRETETGRVVCSQASRGGKHAVARDARSQKRLDNFVRNQQSAVASKGSS